MEQENDIKGTSLLGGACPIHHMREIEDPSKIKENELILSDTKGKLQRVNYNFDK